LSSTEQKISPDDVQAFRESAIYQLATSKFVEAEEGPIEDPEDGYMLMRNFLMINLLIDNGQRAGTLINLQMRHVRNAEKIGDKYVMTVSCY
jgi:hypothetical protein